MIKGIKIKGDLLLSEGFLYEYLYSYFVRFAYKHNLTLGEIIEIPEDMLPDFLLLLSEALESLLEDAYTEPNHHIRSKHPSRYQLIKFKGSKYHVDYRSDLFGAIAYRIYHLIGKVEEKPRCATA